MWQRKTDISTEPFATALFTRKGDADWCVYLIDFENLYEPNITIDYRTPLIHFVRDGENVAIFDTERQICITNLEKRGSTGAVIRGNPPGDWWLKPKLK